MKQLTDAFWNSKIFNHPGKLQTMGKWRIKLARAIIRLGKLIETLPVAVMKPDDLVEYSKQSYARIVPSWCADSVVDEGLKDHEQVLLDTLPKKEGRLLLLGVGGGREAIPLARAGYRVTGLDFVAGMVEGAKKNLEDRGLKMEGMVGDMANLKLMPASYEVIWLSQAMYSSVPTRKRRVAMLRRFWEALAPGGCFICQFHFDKGWKTAKLAELLKKLLSYLTLGNLQYQKGDVLWSNNREFIHVFTSFQEAEDEFLEAGFNVIHQHLPEESRFHGVVLQHPTGGNLRGDEDKP